MTHWDKYLTKEEIISKVQRGSLFGFIKCDVQVPESLRKQFEEMTPIFKNTEVNLTDIGEFMREYAKEHDIKDNLTDYSLVLTLVRKLDCQHLYFNGI